MKNVATIAACALLVAGIGVANASSGPTPMANASSLANDIKRLKRDVKQLKASNAYLLTTKLRTAREYSSLGFTDANGAAVAIARCPAGSVVTGGGGSFGFDTRNGDRLVASEPYPGGWKATGMSYAPIAARTFTAYVICATD
jgi:hypothetical protein